MLNVRIIFVKYYSQIIHYYLTFHIDVVDHNWRYALSLHDITLLMYAVTTRCALQFFVLDTVTLSNLHPLRNYVPYCTSTGYLFNWLRGAWLRGHIRGPPKIKWKINIAQHTPRNTLLEQWWGSIKKYWFWNKK